jgi:predicted RNA-binding Zn-ribbon protein involved in translation (DUF1610 family)
MGQLFHVYLIPMNDFITMTCPSCGASISVTEGPERCRCEYCGNEHMIRPGTAAVEPGRLIRPTIPVPQAVKIEKEGDSARIIQRWFSLKYVPMAFFCVAWDAFLCFWYGMAFKSGAPWIMVVFPIAHLAVGVGLTYSTLCGFFNRTVLEVTRDELSVWFEPLPWLGEKTVKTSDLKQLYCKEKASQGEHGTTRQYRLMAVTRDDKEVQLIANLDSPDVAKYFEQQIETWLKITDQPVVGEY